MVNDAGMVIYVGFDGVALAVAHHPMNRAAALFLADAFNSLALRWSADTRRIPT